MTTDGDKVRAARDTLHRRLGVTLVDDKILTDLDDLAGYLDEEDTDDAEILRRERDEAITRAEAAEVALTDLRAEYEEDLDAARSERDSAERERDEWRLVADKAVDRANWQHESQHKPRRPWDVLREAADIWGTEGFAAAESNCRRLADRLEAEHNAEADRDALVEKAARILHEIENRTYGIGDFRADWDYLRDSEKGEYLDHAAGLLAEAADQ